MIDLIIAFSIMSAAAVACLSLHFEALILIERVTLNMRRLRSSLLLTWIGLLSAHVLEIWLYAFVYWLCDLWGVGTLQGLTTSLDYVYFSAVVFTTLGFGDIIPMAGVRMLAGSEALVGLCLIAWSATVTYARVSGWEADRK